MNAYVIRFCRRCQQHGKHDRDEADGVLLFRCQRCGEVLTVDRTKMDARNKKIHEAKRKYQAENLGRRDE